MHSNNRQTSSKQLFPRKHSRRNRSSTNIRGYVSQKFIYFLDLLPHSQSSGKKNLPKLSNEQKSRLQRVFRTNPFINRILSKSLLTVSHFLKQLTSIYVRLTWQEKNILGTLKATIFLWAFLHLFRLYQICNICKFLIISTHST